MSIKILLSGILSLGVLTFVAFPAHANYDGAYGGVSMGACPNPGGERIATYATGNHQIAGGSLLSGSDNVYRLTDRVYVQCYCPDSSNTSHYGIQSNWIHESYLNADQRHLLTQNGWMRIENGSQWNLSSGAYYVRNTQYQCGVQVKQSSYTHTTQYEDECKDEKNYRPEEKKVVIRSYGQDRYDYDYKKDMREDTKYHIQLMKSKMYDRY